jgi:hypothetical protein
MKQRSHRRLRLTALTSAVVIGLSLVGAGPAHAGGRHGDPAPGTTTTIAAGLNNPRQLSFTPSGDLLVAEAGTGGTSNCQTGPEGGTACFGATGSVTKISSRGQQSRIITGLPSIANEGDGSQASGPSDVIGVGPIVTVLIGLGGTPELRAMLPSPGEKLGTLQTTFNNKSFRTVADLAAFEEKTNPIHDVDSNPVGLLFDKGRYLVADAGGNTVVNVKLSGKMSTLAVLPDPATDIQAVPTSVATVGYDGAYYISQLTGFPFQKGLANIYRLDKRGNLSVYASGLTNVTDLAFNGKTLYAVQISTEGLLTGPIGSVVKVKPNGAVPSVPGDHTPIASGLFAPYGIAIKRNNAYVTTGSVAAGAGQVIKIQL